MNTITKSKKRKYTCPNIVCIELDNDISLALESSPPEGPGETVSVVKPDYFRVNPFEDLV